MTISTGDAKTANTAGVQYLSDVKFHSDRQMTRIWGEPSVCVGINRGIKCKEGGGDIDQECIIEESIILEFLEECTVFDAFEDVQ